MVNNLVSSIQVSTLPDSLSSFFPGLDSTNFATPGCSRPLTPGLNHSWMPYSEKKTPHHGLADTPGCSALTPGLLKSVDR